MDRRKALATTGAISLTATAAVVALGSSMGLFGLANTDNTRVGKLSPIDTTAQPLTTETRTVIVDDPAPATPAAPATGTSGAGRSHEVGEDVQHHATDDGAPAATTSNTTPSATTAHHEAEPGDDHGDDANRGPGSTYSGSGHDDD